MGGKTRNNALIISDTNVVVRYTLKQKPIRRTHFIAALTILPQHKKGNIEIKTVNFNIKETFFYDIYVKNMAYGLSNRHGQKKTKQGNNYFLLDCSSKKTLGLCSNHE